MTTPMRSADALSTPDVSVLIPTFHREDQVVRAVRSVLGASPLRVEVIVADDSPVGSAAGAIAAITDARVRYVRRVEPSGGRPALVRNELFALSSGRYLYFLDDDDTISLSTLAAMIERLDATGRGVAVGVVCPVGPPDSDVVELERRHYARARRRWPAIKHRHELLARLLFHSAIICCSACVIRRDAFAKIGGFDTTMPLYEDVELYIRAIRRFGFTYVDQEFLHRTTGEASLIQNEADTTRTTESYRLMYRSYRRNFGHLEWWALRLYARLLVDAREMP